MVVPLDKTTGIQIHAKIDKQFMMDWKVVSWMPLALTLGHARKVAVAGWLSANAHRCYCSCLVPPPDMDGTRVFYCSCLVPPSDVDSALTLDRRAAVAARCHRLM